MRKARLTVFEQLRYRREVIVQIPDGMTDGELERALDAAQSGSAEFVGDFVWRLEREFGIRCLEYDNDLSSPDSGEVECDYYEFLDEDGE